MILLVLQNQDGIAKESAAQLKWIGIEDRRAGPAAHAAASRPRSSCRPNVASGSRRRSLEVRDLTVRYGGVTAVDVAVADRAAGHGSPG